VAGAVASLVVMVRPQVRGRAYRTRRSRDVQARERGGRAGLRGRPTTGFKSASASASARWCIGSASDNPESPRTYTVVRAGPRWPEIGAVAAEADSAAAGRADSKTGSRGGARGPRSSTPRQWRAPSSAAASRTSSAVLLLIAQSATRGRRAPSHGRERRGARSRRLRRRFRLSRKDQIAMGVSAGAVNANAQRDPRLHRGLLSPSGNVAPRDPPASSAARVEAANVPTGPLR
jgi:hypothetical protein